VKVWSCWGGHLGCCGYMLRVHERHCMPKEEEVGGGQPGYDCVESGDLEYGGLGRWGRVMRVV